MSSPAGAPGKMLGRLPGRIPTGLHDLTHYAAGSLPAPPASVAVPTVPAQPDGTPWGMDDNDSLGCCGVAGINHGFMASAADTSETEVSPADAQVGKYYLTYTGGQDDGVVLSDFLAYVHKKKFYKHTVSAFAPVKIADIPTLQFIINAYDFAYVGINVTNDMMTAVQGSNGPWTWTAEDLGGGEAGGHCIILAGYDSNWLYGVTWGNTIRIAYPAWHRMAEEAWAVLTGEVTKAGTDGHGINRAALTADLNRLNG